jgi:hypothetical protein
MMIRPFTRVLSAAVVVLALALIVATPVQARPLDASRGTAKLSSSLLDGALNWFTGLLTGKTPTSPSSSEKATKPTGGTTTGGGITYVPNTGVCIDPLGNPCVLYPTT